VYKTIKYTKLNYKLQTILQSLKQINK